MTPQLFAGLIEEPVVVVEVEVNPKTVPIVVPELGNVPSTTDESKNHVLVPVLVSSAERYTAVPLVLLKINGVVP